MNRREFLRKSTRAAATLILPGCAASSAKQNVLTSQPQPRASEGTFIDLHCHVGQRAWPCQEQNRFSFEPASTYAPFDAYMSNRLYHGVNCAVGRWYFGVRGEWTDQQADAHVERKLMEHILGARRVDRIVVLALDQHHRTDGTRLGSTRRGARFGTDLYVSNTYVRELCRRHPERLLFGASIHPYRPAATQMLEEVVAAGAVLVKWLPLAQNINAEDPRTAEFLRKAGHLGLPMLIHCGGERALGNMHPEMEDPSPFLRTLRDLRREGTMPTVIVAHVATPSTWPLGSERHHRVMLDALQGEFADAPLYADVAALAYFTRARWLKRLVRMPAIHRKLVYGSDFPIPPSASAFRGELGRRYSEIAAIPNWIDRDVAIKSALGLPEEVFARGGELLKKRLPVMG